MGQQEQRFLEPLETPVSCLKRLVPALPVGLEGFDLPADYSRDGPPKVRCGCGLQNRLVEYSRATCVHGSRQFFQSLKYIESTSL
jgi:hypothetical protein